MQLSFRKLRELHAVTDEEDDAQAQDFVETRLTDQVPAPPCGAAGPVYLACYGLQPAAFCPGDGRVLAGLQWHAVG